MLKLGLNFLDTHFYHLFSQSALATIAMRRTRTKISTVYSSPSDMPARLTVLISIPGLETGKSLKPDNIDHVGIDNSLRLRHP